MKEFIYGSPCIFKRCNHRYLPWLSHKLRPHLTLWGPQNLLSSESLKVASVLILKCTPPPHALYAWLPVSSAVLGGSANSRKWNLDGGSRSLVAGPVSMLPSYHELSICYITPLWGNQTVDSSSAFFPLVCLCQVFHDNDGKAGQHTVHSCSSMELSP